MCVWGGGGHGHTQQVGAGRQAGGQWLDCSVSGALWHRQYKQWNIQYIILTPAPPLPCTTVCCTAPMHPNPKVVLHVVLHQCTPPPVVLHVVLPRELMELEWMTRTGSTGMASGDMGMGMGVE